MLEEREVIAATVGVVVYLFVVVNREKLSQVPHSRILLVSFGMLTASLLCSVIEVLVWKELFNFLQHVLALTSIVLLAIWSWLTFVRGDGVSA